jgi:hypothetical protein
VGGLYRRSEISLAFKTEAQMETTLTAIVEDVRINARIQKIPVIEVKTVTLEADLVEPNPNPLIF